MEEEGIAAEEKGIGRKRVTERSERCSRRVWRG